MIAIDQTPIGRTPRSNPATYTGLFDLIRDVFAATPDAKARRLQAEPLQLQCQGARRCEACSGDGIVKIEMHFLSDVYVPCDVCGGKRYNRETLEVRYKGKSIYDVLEMTVDEALDFFRVLPKLANKLQTMHDVGLGYVKLGQSSTTLSGGEAQRIKLATELSRAATGRTMYILDEPTTGLHTGDVERLNEILQRLADAGNSLGDHRTQSGRDQDCGLHSRSRAGGRRRRRHNRRDRARPNRSPNAKRALPGAYLKQILNR